MEQRGREQWYSKLFRILNSTASFVVAFVVINALSWFVLALVGKIFKLDAIVYYDSIKFLPDDQWVRHSVILVFGSGPVFALVFGLLMMYLYGRLKNIRTALNLFFIWAFVIGTGIFCAQAAVASLGANTGYNSPFYQGFSVVFAWLYFNEVLIYVTNIPFALALVFFAVNIAKPFLSFAYSYTKVNKLKRRRKYFFETAIVPYIIGSIAVLIIDFPQEIIFLHVAYLVIIGLELIIAWYALHYIEILKDEVIKYKGLQSPSAFLLGSMVLMIILARTILWYGINMFFK